MKRRQHKTGFTLVELLVASSVMVVVSAGILSFYILLQNVWHRQTMAMTTSQKACTALNRMVYGRGMTASGLRSANKDSVWEWSDTNSYIVVFNTNRWFWYNASTDTITDETGAEVADRVAACQGSISNGGISLSVTLVQTAGRHTVTGSMETFVAFRN